MATPEELDRREKDLAAREARLQAATVSDAFIARHGVNGDRTYSDSPARIDLINRTLASNKLGLSAATLDAVLTSLIKAGHKMSDFEVAAPPAPVSEDELPPTPEGFMVLNDYTDVKNAEAVEYRKCWGQNNPSPAQKAFRLRIDKILALESKRRSEE